MAIEQIGGHIFHAAGEFAKEYNLDYFDTKNVTFTVVDTDQANAFVLPGNHIFCKYVCQRIDRLIFLPFEVNVCVEMHTYLVCMLYN
jgi:hypothetical protein